MGGAGGVDGGTALAPPSCLRALFAACPTDGACRSAPTDAGGQPTLYCYANGAQAEYTHREACTGDGRDVLQVRKPDGSLCYTFEVSGVLLAQACESATYTWTDASGQVIATGGSGLTQTSVTCAGSSEGVSCVRSSSCTLTSIFIGTGCQSGGCP
jgi:hypothetical protein